ncbi:MAG: MerR family transcriptional regulator [Siphonobacter aquaeclarae]|nr:MerR family transcriptional regulator [Siphonobacter aquaeclarae]
METEQWITVVECSRHYQIEVSFLEELREYGLIEVVVQEEVPGLEIGQLARLEKLIRLHDDLNINIEGLDAVMHLIQKLEDVQNELSHLKNRLRLYEH